MTSTTSFRDLEVWQESMTLVEEIYALSKSFPRDELFGLTAQVRKAAVSIPSNIGEGALRKRHYARLQKRVERVGKMLNGLIASIQPGGPWTWCLVTLGIL